MQFLDLCSIIIAHREEIHAVVAYCLNFYFAICHCLISFSFIYSWHHLFVIFFYSFRIIYLFFFFAFSLYLLTIEYTLFFSSCCASYLYAVFHSSIHFTNTEHSICISLIFKSNGADNHCFCCCYCYYCYIYLGKEICSFFSSSVFYDSFHINLNCMLYTEFR